MADVTNPGLVNVADEAFDGLPAEVPPFKSIPVQTSPDNRRGEVSQVDVLSVDQPVTKSVPASTALDTEQGIVSVQMQISVDQAVTVQRPGEPLVSFNGDLKKPGRGVAAYVLQNSAVNVVSQTYGNGQVANVFV